MKDKLIPILMVFGLSMFCGILIVGIGLGSVLIPLDGIGSSVVCGDRDLQLERNTYTYIPGQETTIITAYCVNEQTGSREEVTEELYNVTEKIRVANGVISGILFFFLGMWFLRWAARRLNIPFEELFMPTARRSQR
jgi:hypothetical protein